MRLKKISILSILLVFLLPNLAKAEMLFLDNNAISNFSDVNTHLVVSEFNTGKIISKRGENKQVSVSNLPNHLALFLLTDDLKNNKISLDTKINITNSDAILNKYNLGSSISVDDALFLLENEESDALLQAIFTKYDLTIEKAKDILSSMSLNDTTLASLTIDEKNMSTAKNMSYLTNMILRNYPKLTEITKNPEVTLSSGSKATNNVSFIESDKFRRLHILINCKKLMTIYLAIIATNLH